MVLTLGGSYAEAMSDPQTEPVITHAHLLAGIEVMRNDVSHIRRELERISESNNAELIKIEAKHDKAVSHINRELERISQSNNAELIKIEAKHEKAIDALHVRIDPLKTRVDQGVILSVLAAIVFPVLIGLAFHKQNQPASTDQSSSLQRQ